MSETEQLIKDFLGEEKFFEFQRLFGGVNIYVTKPGADSIWYHYKVKFLTERQIALKLNVSEAFVYKVVKQKRKENK